MNVESWLPVSGYEGFYEVSTFGNVKSLNFNKTKTHRLLSFKIHRHGYVSVMFQVKGLQKRASVHRLVANAFIPNPENKPQVNHVDGNKQNNRVDNLEWNTKSENMMHASKMGLMKPCRAMLGKFGKLNHLSKPVIQMNADGDRINKFYGLSEAERATGISHSCIIRVCKGKQPMAGGFKWMYENE